MIALSALSICRRSVFFRGLAARGPPGAWSKIPNARLAIWVRQASGASSASSAGVAAVQAARLAGECIRALPAGAMDASTLSFEFFQCGRQ